MRLVFAGTPPFSVCALEALHDAGHEIALVLTRPDRPSGRGLKSKPSAVATAAAARHLPVSKLESLKTPESLAALSAVGPDLMVVAAYGLILPVPVLTIPRFGCLNVHASLLPRWRGAAPVQRAILAADEETGVGIMVMEQGLDTGPVLLERRVRILPGDTAGILTERLARAGAVAIVEALAKFGSLEPRAQDASKATYALKVEKSEAPLDWLQDAATLDRQIRAFNPFPGAETSLGGETLKVWAALPLDMAGSPGTVIGSREGCPIVACGHGSLVLTLIQRPGSRRLLAAEFTKARPMPPGMILGMPKATGA